MAVKVAGFQVAAEDSALSGRSAHYWRVTLNKMPLNLFDPEVLTEPARWNIETAIVVPGAFASGTNREAQEHYHRKCSLIRQALDRAGSPPALRAFLPFRKVVARSRNSRTHS